MKVKTILLAVLFALLCTPAFTAAPPTTPTMALSRPDTLAFADGDWAQRRKAILMGDLKVLATLTDEQMAALDGLALAVQPMLDALYRETFALRGQIRVLAADWQTNFDQIVHLEFVIYTKEFQTRMVRERFGHDVSLVLTEPQRFRLPLVLHTMYEAYHLMPPHPQQQLDEVTPEEIVP